ncbi:MAG: PQQ-binding-like beta-propeller repeat protein [Novosphingobium sp.]|nr:PQQ-binding-like beta-propeller repeat protein [Novosphingobium sp.]
MKLSALPQLVGRWLYGLILLAVGGTLAFGGARLILLGGSFYYLPAGLAALAAGVAVLMGKWRTGAKIYLGLMAVTLIWGLVEAGLDGWALMPRLLSPFILGLPFLLAAIFGGQRTDRLAGLATAAVAAVLIVAVAASSGFQPVKAAGRENPALAADASGDWLNLGNTQWGTTYSPLTEINPDNAGKLDVAWQVPLGPMPAKPLSQTQVVPLKVGDHLYICTPFDDIIDLEPETGKIRWHYQAKPNLEGLYVTRCRGMSYYAVPEASGACSQRVYIAGSDGNLFALDALTGKLCPGFGEGGEVNLLEGLEQRNRGYYRVTSPAAVIRGKLVVGGAVADGQYVGEPSGVIRAYDAVTGELAWAWDMDNPENRKGPKPGEFYSPGTPNSWGPMSADEELGLVYVPTGNATPDYWGGHRSEASNRYASSVVALDAETGEPRWSFQTTHYDVWDYDVASQPVLFDLRKDGKVIPALLQNNKRGQLFVLDRSNGKPIYPVVERPAPQEGAVEKLSPTQPWSPELPDLGGPPPTEQNMWGISALDQLWCRIKFREARFDGSFTPPGVTSSISYPGYFGGGNWASASIDTGRQLAFILSNRMVNYNRLVPRSDPTISDLKADSAGNLGGLAAQEGTPYAADIKFFFSPLGVPCQQPPVGVINAVDLNTGKMVWSRPLGTARDMGPLGISSHLPFTIGTPLFGGAMSTAGGIVFTGGSQDHTFRAFDSETGKLLFEADIPGMSATKPMTFRSSRNGKQYVVVASDAPHRDGSAYAAITAFALPEKR